MQEKLTVQITLAGLGDPATSLVLILLEDTDLLKGLHDLAVNGAGGIDVVGWARTTVAGGAVDLAKTADTDGLAEVDVAGDGRGANVVPVDGLRWELLGGAGLDRVNPTCDIALASGLLKITSLPPAVATEGRKGKYVPGIGSFPCLFKKAEYALMNFCAWITTSNQHHSVNRSHSDSLAPARFFIPNCVYVCIFLYPGRRRNLIFDAW